MKKIKEKIFDFYLAYSLVIDTVLIISVWNLHKICMVFEFRLIDRNNQINIISNLINCSVSLAGFLLAALTIIVTFRSNIKAKGLEEANNAMEMILSSPHYNNIVRIFKNAIIEFTICFIVLVIVWAASDNLSIWTINRINVSGIICISLTIFRSLLILFSIIQMDNGQRK